MNTLRLYAPALACMLCQGLAMSMASLYGFFVSPLAQEFSASVATINSGIIIMLLMGIIASPTAGKLADRFAIRHLMWLGICIAMLSLWGIAQASSLAVMGICFALFAFGIAFYGPVTVSAFLTTHYQQHLGRMLAVAAIGVSIGSIVLPVSLAWLMEQYAWREALFILASASAAILLVTVAVGIPSTRTATTRTQQTTDNSFLNQKPFWIIGIAVAICFSAGMVLVLSYPPHFATLGMTTADTGYVFAAGGAAGATGKLLFAVFSDRYKHHLRLIAMVVVGLQAIAAGLLSQADSHMAVLFSVTLFGFGGGVFIPLQPFMNSVYFNHGVIGSVNGLQMALVVPLGAIGAPLAGYVYDTTGSYTIVYQCLACIFAACLVMIYRLRPAVQTA